MHETSHNRQGRYTDYRRLTPGGRHDRHPLVTLLIEAQLKEDITTCQFHSLCLVESCDITDISQLAVFIRMVFPDGCTRDEFCVFGAFVVDNTWIRRLSCINFCIESFWYPTGKTCVGSMTGSHNGLIALLRADDKFPSFLSYHCVIHQESLCASKLSFEQVFKEVVNIVNFIRASPLRHRQFREFISDIEDTSGVVPLRHLRHVPPPRRCGDSG